ncbi:MAG: hypothetical protein ACHQAX_05635 [Gammaproteobacteria bacterium]
MMMKVTQIIATVCSVVLATVLLAGCNSKGENKSKDYHTNDMERMDKKSAHKHEKGTYGDK